MPDYYNHDPASTANQDILREQIAAAIASGIDVQSIVNDLTEEKEKMASAAREREDITRSFGIGPSDLEILQSNGG